MEKNNKEMYLDEGISKTKSKDDRFLSVTNSLSLSLVKWKAISAVLLITLIIMSFVAINASGKVAVRLIPQFNPDKSFFTENDGIKNDLMGATYFMQILNGDIDTLLSFTSSNISARFVNFLGRVHPSVYQEMKTILMEKAQDLSLKEISQFFILKDIKTSKNSKNVFVISGLKIVFSPDLLEPLASKEVMEISYSYSNGIPLVSGFKLISSDEVPVPPQFKSKIQYREKESSFEIKSSTDLKKTEPNLLKEAMKAKEEQN